MIKAQQKISRMFRRLDAAQHFACIRGYSSIARKQGQRLLEVLR
jgi:hypothetical protein